MKFISSFQFLYKLIGDGNNHPSRKTLNVQHERRFIVLRKGANRNPLDRNG